MSRLKTLPWMNILLFLVFAAAVANYLEMRRMERAVGSLYVAILETRNESEDIGTQAKATNDYLGQANDNLDRIADLLDCIAYHRGGCGVGR